ncbi:hypothetical protein PACTADRAFT_50197 [Pachysolen tannophilus NRRL Y-2460]|uniref:AB hydrolase-1 domain-containing protein n=1 Tax=Pachysolen tannophilus NRRL Y-2460 TaxID=669874 RepID=A0A1E4TUQ6_PACTA|nr:hypothetical protein PACTADRAFT_50197 [Pachysolen tannophilus NRRL Y-2460]
MVIIRPRFSFTFSRKVSTIINSMTIGRPAEMGPNIFRLTHADAKELPVEKVVDLYFKKYLPISSCLPTPLNRPQEPLIFIPGLFGSTKMYKKEIQRLCNLLNIPVYAVDLRSHGQSKYALPLSFNAYVSDMVAFMKQQGIERANVSGFSLGGKVAMALALKHPELVSKTLVVDISPATQIHLSPMIDSFIKGLTHVVEDAGINSKDKDWFEQADNALEKHVPHKPTRRYLLNTNLLREHPVKKDGKVHLKCALYHFKSSEILGWPEDEFKGKTYLGPVLFLKAKHSDFIQDSHMDQIEQYFPNYEIREVNTYHLIPNERPDFLIQNFANFIGKKESSF